MNSKDLDEMTFSAMRRVCLIVLTVSESDEHLSPGDRMHLIYELMESNENQTPESINKKCAVVADENLGINIRNAGIILRAERGY